MQRGKVGANDLFISASNGSENALAELSICIITRLFVVAYNRSKKDKLIQKISK